MKLFGYELKKVAQVTNKNVPRPEMADILKKIVETQLFRTREDIDNWRSSMSLAESKLNPDRTYLIRLYKDIVLDAHLSSLMSTIEFEVAASPFFIDDANGEVNEDLTKMFRKTWFLNFVKYIVEAEFYGYSLVQFEDIRNDVFSDACLVPREYVIPEKKAVKTNLMVTRDGLTYFDSRPYDLWTIFVERKDDLGILCKAAPYVIWKKNVLGAWSEAAELFGMPIRTGKTDINNPTAYSNMVKMLSQMGSASWGVFDNEDNIEFVEITKSDYYQVYDKLIERVNSELSKLILGQTMTSDNGSSRSQADVHKEILDGYVMALKRKITGIVNDKLFPIMAVHGIIPSGISFRYDDEEKASLEVKFKWAVELVKTGKFTVPADWFEQTFGLPVEEMEEPEEIDPLTGKEKPEDDEDDDENGGVSRVSSVMPSAAELYNEMKNHSH